MRRVIRSNRMCGATAHAFTIWFILGSVSSLARAQSLSALIDEAERNNPQIIAAKHAWRAAAQVPSQVSTLPDPQLTVQQFAVGSPRPFAGFTNSDFAYIGFGVSQDLPYPGKLRLRGEAAKLEADVGASRVESVRRSIVEQLKMSYFQLAYELEELSLLERDGKLLDQVEKIAEANYRVGKRERTGCP
jgi:cobalt-zinc-cadmium efflux system outer membrane protein